MIKFIKQKQTVVEPGDRVDIRRNTMYILVMLWDDLNEDVFIDLAWFNTLSDAVAEGKRRCVDKGDHFQIWKQTAGQSDMDVILEEEYDD